MGEVSALVICFEEEPTMIGGAIRSLASQSREPDQVVVVDNSHDSRHRNAAEREGVEYVRSGRNLGFPQAVNLGAGLCRGDYIFLLNPDAEASTDCLELLEAALEADPVASIAGAQIILPDGRVNAGENPVHLSGLSWSGNFRGMPTEGVPRATLAVSGAAMLLRRESFERLGGFHPALFMYFDDSDLCWRTRLAGSRVLFCPEARVTHDYEFLNGRNKFRWLEEGRISAVLTNYESRTLVLLAPLLLAAEAATWLSALRGHWIGQKAGAWLTIWRNRRLLRDWRRKVASLRAVSDRELLPEFAPVVETPLIESRSAGALPRLQRAYASLVSKLA